MSLTTTTTPTLQYIDEVEIDSATDSTINLSWTVKGTSHSPMHITGFQVHFQKVASSYIQYSAMLSSMTTSYKIRNLVADTFYKVCVVMYRNDTTQAGGAVGGGGVGQPRQKCTDSGTASWHLPVSVGSSVGAIIALSLIVLMVLIARCPSIMRHRKGGAHAGGKYDSMTSNLHDDHLEMSDTTLHVHEEEDEDEGEDEEDEEGKGEAAAALTFADPQSGIIVEVPVTFHEHILKQQQLQHLTCQPALTHGYCNGGNNNRRSRHHLHHQHSVSSPPMQQPHHYLIQRASIPQLHYHTRQQQQHQNQTEFVSATHLDEYPIPLAYLSEAEGGYHIAPAAVCPHQAAGHARRTHLKRQISKGKYEGCVNEPPHCSHQHSTIVKIEPQPKIASSKIDKQPSVDVSSPL